MCSSDLAPEDRLALTRKLIRTATDTYQIPVEDIVIDPLAMPLGADTGNTMRTLETLALVRDEFGVNTTLGASNLSFGMPDRHALTAAFLPLAAAHGLTSAIMDARTPPVVTAARAADLLLGRDDWGAAWIAAFRAAQLPPGGATPSTPRGTSDGKAIISDVRSTPASGQL